MTHTSSLRNALGALMFFMLSASGQSSAPAPAKASSSAPTPASAPAPATTPATSPTPATATAPAATTAPAKVTLKDIRVVLHTTKGDIAGTLYASKAPMTTANYLNLSQKGFYNGLTFHRVINPFMIQGGDPLGNGMGGPGYKFDNEIDSSLKFDKPGVFAMANAGPNTNGSQFFITHVPYPSLDGHYNIFGQVTSGQDVVNKIVIGDKINTIEILDPTDELFKAQAANLAKWNAVLKK